MANEVLAALYIVRADVSITVRQVSRQAGREGGREGVSQLQPPHCLWILYFNDMMIFTFFSSSSSSFYSGRAVGVEGRGGQHSSRAAGDHQRARQTAHREASLAH